MRTEIASDMNGTVWKILVGQGHLVAEEEVLMVLESMKMEIPILSPCAGNVLDVLVGEGESVTEGQVLMVIDEI